MKIKSVEKVVQVHAEVQTDLGEFRVLDSEVQFWNDYHCEWAGEIIISTVFGDDVLEAVREAGMNMLHFNKGV